ncbi:MAG TPA: glycoside hydrolase family 5 protein [Acidobacteriaceae bacterium]|jgi:aryl-phospho-beta-D-glucosidase BglC (GH1 family)|nr:glycoside hydrolase family 5 protein [Acidobacteriaceae bacterium]
MQNTLRCCALLFLSALLPCLPAIAQNDSAPPSRSAIAFERAQHLQHGINTSIWFAQSSDYSLHRLQTFTTADDIALIERMGFDHCRISIDAGPLTAWQYAHVETPFMNELDHVVKVMLDHHLSVIIDIHPTSEYKAQLLQGSDGVGNFVALWRTLAAHFAPVDPEHVFFEIMNEPEQNDPYRWQGVQASVVDAIRQGAPQNTIIAAGAHWSGLQDLLVLEPLADPNIIYTFHDYEPFPFTHQGATWTDPRVRPERSIPYPSTPDNIAPKLDQEPTLDGQYFLDEYGENRWDAARVENSIDFAAKWSTLHHVPVYCGEFGVLRDYAPPAARAQWLHDMRVALEKNHIGWAMWDYQTNFGVVTKANGTTTPDAAILTALGLHMPQP